jgi:uncharacterized protein YjbJ (UPF0337 family)
MSATDTARNTIDKAVGKAREAAGRAAGDRNTESRGRGDQTKADLKDAGEKIKDAFRR